MSASATGVGLAGSGQDAPAHATGRLHGHGVWGALRSVLTRLALGAPARIFVIEGADPPGPVDELRLRDDVRLVDTPRSATVLLVTGQLPEAVREAAMRAHDAMAHPRTVVWWTHDPMHGTAMLFPGAVVVRHAASTAAGARTVVSGLVDLAGLAAALRQAHVELVRGERASDPALLPDVDPAPWRGEGPYGQGGSGMTGGVPYGRPMAGRAPDRDGLELDQLPVRVGPFFAAFPAGLTLDVKLQGDVVQEVVVPGNAFAGSAAGAQAPDPFRAALAVPTAIGDLERARARHHLRWLAHALRVHGLEALAHRTLALAVTLAHGTPTDAAADVAALGRLLERSLALGWATAGVGVTDAALVTGCELGPVARAAGVAEDARADDPVYQALGFEPAVQPGRHHVGTVGDARARWRQRIAEAIQSLELADRARDRRTEGRGVPVEGPRGRLRADGQIGAPSAALVALLPELLRGQEWGDAVTIVVSLDIDVREAAEGAPPLAPPPAPTAQGGMGGMKMGAKGHTHHALHHAHDAGR